MMAEPQIRNEVGLEELLTQPSAADIAAASGWSGDVLVLGAGGKMGPTLAVRIKRAIQEAGAKHRVIVVVRKDREGVFAAHKDGIDLIETDLLDPASYARMPDAENVVFMAGRKFGSVGDQPMTWATNVWMAGLAAHRFRHSRIVAFSTGNVYPFMPIQGRGADETVPTAPTGEYAQSALGRERLFEYISNAHGTPTLIFRLNYAVDLRYGVLVDIGQKVLDGKPIDLTTGYANVIWQGDANSYCLRSFSLCTSPARFLNVTGQRTISVREMAERFGSRFGKMPQFTGGEAATALLSDSSLCTELLGPPEVSEDELFEMTANWLSAGGVTLGKPTKFESRDGRF
ncbi:NAD-dependent epimerase/dehydratase family protein [Terriglobus saanensis]|uniref:NAD-dependent epimerase/dehydratase n=1 Tax=Terriglobus saanensis (strain ATCC BAA-1853 / DSM 23119 / SP1PR4) TaxID=401053 RepID=E8V2N9_TERSS|nr:NAD(P)-dependent oxidoreductase [Terriglobus saanensis]ADV83514.1 NAD-dependent epimerase/dehydratase [Terriglobus saanensis SP1PR4]